MAWPRFEWSLEPNDLSLLLQAKRAAGTPIIDLTESNPTRAGFQYPAEIAAALGTPASLLYEPSPWGLPSAREAVARVHDVDPSRVMITASTSESYSFLFKLLCGPGDEVLVPAPSYPLFEFLAKLECAQVRPYPLVYDGSRWQIDFQGLESALTKRTQAICVVNPNNPTGSYLKRDEADRLVSVAASRGIPILSDEVFSSYPLTDDPTRVETLAGVTEVPTFCLSGLSKMAGLPQMKAGWIVVSAPEAARERLELIADTFLSVSAPVQHALPRLLESGADVRGQIRRRTAANLEWLLATGLESLAVEGGWYVVVPLPAHLAEAEFTLQLLEEQDTLVQPGFFYDFAEEPYAVVSLLASADRFQEGIRRLHLLLG